MDSNEMGSSPDSTKASNKHEIEDPNRPNMNHKTQSPTPADDATNTGPRILARHHHRRRNIAIDTWGPEFLVSMRDSLPCNEPKGQPFNVYKAILRHNNVFYLFAIRLPFALFMSLYAIDKEFHWRINKHYISAIREYAVYHAHDAAEIFGWALYPSLCISDPMLKPMDSRIWLARDVPSLRWVAMVLWRQNVVRSILTILAMEGHQVPAACETMLMKFWCLMETNVKKQRIAYVCNEEIWTDSDIIHFQLFLMKLDMRFTDPILGSGAAGLSQTLLSQKSLSTLWKVLSGKLRGEYDDLLKMVRGTYHHRDLDLDQVPWLLDPLHNPEPRINGWLSLEHWDEDGANLPLSIYLVINEGIKRQLHVQKYYIDFILYGCINDTTGKNLPVPRHLRGKTEVQVSTEGWPEDKARTKLIKELDRRFGVSKTKEKDKTMQQSP